MNILVPYGPGGTTDIVARYMAEHFRQALGQNVVVENKPGASGTIAMGTVVKAPPDGHTLPANDIAQTVVNALYDKLPFDPINDLTAISIVAETPYILAVSKDVQAKDLRELVAYGKANPGKLNFGSGGIGSGPHIAGELLKRVAGINMQHVAYRGSGPALNDLLTGQIQILCSAAPTVAPHVAGGSIRALAVTGTKRVPLVPDVPTSAEAGLPDFNFAGWFGLAGAEGLAGRDHQPSARGTRQDGEPSGPASTLRGGGSRPHRNPARRGEEADRG